jgi:hypothetical protein
MSRSGLFTFENEPIWLIHDSNSLIFLIVLVERCRLFEILDLESTRYRLFEIPVLAFVSLFWFIVSRALRRTTDFVQMPPRLSSTAWDWYHSLSLFALSQPHCDAPVPFPSLQWHTNICTYVYVSVLLSSTLLVGPAHSVSVAMTHGTATVLRHWRLLPCI